MIKNILAAYKSTLIGIAIPVLTVLIQALQSPPINWKAVGYSCLLTLLLSLTDLLKEKKKKSNRSFKNDASKIIPLLIIVSALFSCNVSKHTNAPTPAPTLERTITITKQVKDTVLVVKADTMKLAAKLVADSTGKISITGTPKFNTTSSTKNSTIKANIDDDNNLSIDCFCDTSALFFRWEQENKVDSSTHTIYPAPLPAIEKPFTKWQMVQIWAGRIFLTIITVVIIGKIAKFF